MYGSVICWQRSEAEGSEAEGSEGSASGSDGD
jgi:hypothetical protein